MSLPADLTDVTPTTPYGNVKRIKIDTHAKPANWATDQARIDKGYTHFCTFHGPNKTHNSDTCHDIVNERHMVAGSTLDSMPHKDALKVVLTKAQRKKKSKDAFEARRRQMNEVSTSFSFLPKLFCICPELTYF